MNAALNSPSTSSQNPKPKLLDQMCYVLRKLHYKKRTEEPPPLPPPKGEYVNWVKGGICQLGQTLYLFS